MESIYTILLEKLKARKFAKIDENDYSNLMSTLALDYYMKDRTGQAVPQSYFELRNWIYDRVVKDMTYKHTGYLNEHFCIGVIFGALRLFDEFFSDKEFMFRKVEESV